MISNSVETYYNTSSLRLIHTADWHLGHFLHDVDREFEHKAFLDWLLALIKTREIDALLVAGDIFDSANPSASSQSLWYSFLARAVKACPKLQVVAIAGNHDSAARLEAPNRLLREFAIHVVGNLPRVTSGEIIPEDILVTLKDKQDVPRAIVVAMPFLRPGDIITVGGGDDLIEGLRVVYEKAFSVARSAGLPILAMGHCYMVDGQLSELSERKILGGNQHAIPISVFPQDVSYAALGHLHLCQSFDGDRVRYAGSPIPLSIPERVYHHSVTEIIINKEGQTKVKEVPIPRSVNFFRIPEEGFLTVDEALDALHEISTQTTLDPQAPKPFLEVGLKLEKPEGGLRARIDATIEGKGYYLAKITTQYSGTGLALGDGPRIHGLRDLQVEEVFRRKWAKDFPGEPSEQHLAALHELIDQVGQARPV
jgi:exonuclease SbcD